MMKNSHRFFYLFLTSSVAVAVAVGLFAANKRWKNSDLAYLKVGCRIFDRQLTLVFNSDVSSLCDFDSSGHVADITNGVRNRLGKYIYRHSYASHHDMKFVENGRALAFIYAEDIDFKGRIVKSDCFIKVSMIDFKEIRWCLKDHLSELEARGYVFTPQNTQKYAFSRIKSETEISHANTISEIPPNSRESEFPMLKSGNYLINLFGAANLMLILDHELKNILWVCDLDEFLFQTEPDDPGLQNFVRSTSDVRRVYTKVIAHDAQVTPTGRIVMHATLSFVESGKAFKKIFRIHGSEDEAFRQCRANKPEQNQVRLKSYALRWDPFSKTQDVEILWKSRHDLSAGSPIRGNITRLGDGRYAIFSGSQTEPKLIVVSNEGERLETIEVPPSITKANGLIWSIQPMSASRFVEFDRNVDF